MTHIQSRLQTRSLDFTAEQLQAIAEQYSESTAVILGKRESEEGRMFGMVLIVLIVRNRRPVTVMTRRQTQRFDKRNFQVDKIVYL